MMSTRMRLKCTNSCTSIHGVPFISASDKAMNNIPHKLEIEYGSTGGQKLDILGTDLPDGEHCTHFIVLILIIEMESWVILYFSGVIN